MMDRGYIQSSPIFEYVRGAAQGKGIVMIIHTIDRDYFTARPLQRRKEAMPGFSSATLRFTRALAERDRPPGQRASDI